MARLLGLIWLLLIGLPQPMTAQEAGVTVWVQIEARPTLESARERAASYASSLPDVNGFAIEGGWYAIALGPYTQTDAETVIASYRARGLIPSDSYIARSDAYGAPYWPPQLSDGGVRAVIAPAEPPPAESALPTVAAPEPRASAARAGEGEDAETPAEARRGEALLSAAERRELQEALRWAGVYDAAIDGAFGAGTRAAMGDWQRRNGLAPTGVLTTRQRALLLGQYKAILDGLGMATVRDAAAGIEILMPTDVVSFGRHEAPFAHYDPLGDMPARVLLISQQGGSETLASLYEIMQSLSIVPLDGPRRLDGDGFTLVGREARIVSETQVERIGDEIKGFTLVWPAGDEARRVRLLEAMRSSFTRLPGTLDPTAGSDLRASVDLFAGIDIRRPRLSRTGFFVDDAGTVVTTAAAVESCARITLDDEFDAALAEVDIERGVAVLKPKARLAPPAVARFSPVPPRPRTEVAVAGYSFEGQLDAPSVTFGTLSDLQGLAGEPDVSRLSIEALPGDEGGPVVDASGNVFGMLLPQPGGNRQLPQEVRFALGSDAITEVLARAGFTAASAESAAPLDPVDIGARALAMTVLVNCWE